MKRTSNWRDGQMSYGAALEIQYVVNKRSDVEYEFRTLTFRPF
jgi:hypothetical protein